MKIILFIIMILTFESFLFCGPTLPEVTRTDIGQQIDISGRWNDTDSRLVSEEMIKDVLQGKWLSEFKKANPQKKPRLIVGTIKNKSYEHINVGTFIKDLEKSITNSGKAVFVASKEEREEIREERKEQSEYASEETMKEPGKEYGADYMLKGEINSIEDWAGGVRLVYYQVNLEMINVETNEKVWIGEKKIKKVIEQSGYSP